MSNRLNWQSITEDANIDYYNIYRSIVGVESANDGLFALVDGMTLEVQIDGGSSQIFTFVSADFSDIGSASAGEISSVLNDNGVGLLAYSGVSDSVYIRSDNNSGSVRVVGGTSNSILGFSTTLYSEKSHFLKIAEHPHAEGVLEYIDEDGHVLDWYKMSAVDNLAVESAKTIEKQAGPSREPMCLVYGKLEDSKGYAICDKEIKATIEYPPAIDGVVLSGVTREEQVVLSLRDGTFELELIQRASYRVVIPAIEFNRIVSVPEEVNINLFAMEFEEKDGDSGGEDFNF